MLPVSPKLLIEYFIQDILKIAILGLLFSIIAVIYSLSLQNYYSSSATVTANLSDTKSVSGSLGNLGNLASLAGVSLGGDTLSPEVLKEMLQSSSFIAEFARSQGIIPYIFAAKSYEPESDLFYFQESIYDAKTKEWTREVEYPRKQDPDDSEVADKFKEALSVSYDRKTKLIQINFKSLSPKLSKETISSLIHYFNEYMRKVDTENYESSIHYLNEQLSQTQYSEVKVALQQIIEEQYKKLTLAKTRDEYALRTIQAPMKAFKKSEPQRAIICLAITSIGTFISVIIIWSVRIFRGKE